jgi:plasmid stabilization system protein ParE
VKNAFAASYTLAARGDLDCLFDFWLDRAKVLEDLELAQHAIDALRAEIEERLSRTPLVCHKAGESPFVRELIVAFGASGYVVKHDIAGYDVVNILAVRHQREEDYH